MRDHERTKHHFNRFAPGPGRLDWANQPDPFRRYAGAPLTRLPILGPDEEPVSPAYEDLFRPGAVPAAPLTPRTLSRLLEYALALSAWKQAGGTRWALRANPSSGNLHPTEGYLLAGGIAELGEAPGLFHYAPREHALERRADCPPTLFERLMRGFAPETVLVGLSSVYWREAWKYGERAFRYCQHDLGHAIAAVTFAAQIAGWNTTLTASWPHARIAALTGLDRDADFLEAEREEPGCLLVLARDSAPPLMVDADERLSTAVGNGRWHGRASQLSEDHVQWTFIDEIAAATRDEGRTPPASTADARGRVDLPELP